MIDAVTAGLPDGVKNVVGAAIAAGIGAAAGGGVAGAAAGVNEDTNNRQLHPVEIKWISDHAKQFADKEGISPAEAEQRLAQQAFRQDQMGASGSTDDAARTFLLDNTRGMQLPGDPNVSGQNMGYAFRATPEQQTNPNIYGASYANDPAVAAFYGRNGLVQPDPSALQQAVDNSTRNQNGVRNATLGAAAVAAAIAGPVLGMAAIETCLMNPAGCTSAGIAAGEVAAGPALGPTGMGVGNSAVRAGETVAGREARMADEAGVTTGSPISTRFVNGVTVVDQRTGATFNGAVDLQPTFDRIAAGGSGLSRNDGTVFKNLPDRTTGEVLLPVKPPGYYTEYVVPTTGINGPGPQRVVTGQGGEIFYTPNHYVTFIPVKKP